MPDDGIVLSDVIREPGSIAENLADSSIINPEEMADDQICVTIREDEVPDNILKAVLWGLAEEQSSLKVLRVKQQREGKDSSHISIKRGTLLKYMSETLLQRQSLHGSSDEIDFKGPKFREVFKMFLQTISDTFDQVKIPVEYREMFFHALSKNLDGWEKKAEGAVKKLLG